MRRTTAVARRTPAAARTGDRPSPLAAEEPAAATARPDLARTSRLGHRFAPRPSAFAPAPAPPVQPLGGEGSEEEEGRPDEARGERSAPRREELPFGGILPPLPPAAAPPRTTAPPPDIRSLLPENLDPISRLHGALGSEEAADRFLGQSLLAQRRAQNEHRNLGPAHDLRTVAATADPDVPFTASSDQLRGRRGFFHPGTDATSRQRQIAQLATSVGLVPRPTEPLGKAQLHAEPTHLLQQTAPTSRLTETQRGLPTGVSRRLCTTGICGDLFRADADRHRRVRAIADPERLHLFPPNEPPLRAAPQDLLRPTLPGPAALESRTAPPPPVASSPAPVPADERLPAFHQATAALHNRLREHSSRERSAALLEAHERARERLAGAADPERTFHQGLGSLVAAARGAEPFRTPARLLPTLEPELRPEVPAGRRKRTREEERPRRGERPLKRSASGSSVDPFRDDDERRE
jgi:hypothetical protein